MKIIRFLINWRRNIKTKRSTGKKR